MEEHSIEFEGNLGATPEPDLNDLGSLINGGFSRTSIENDYKKPIQSFFLADNSSSFASIEFAFSHNWSKVFFVL